jgi:Ca-activated chloride channel family protein
MTVPLSQAQSQTPVFKVDTNLQSIAVQVTDKNGRYVKGLAASDFTLFEDGRPQKIAFFEGESEPMSVAILVDASRTMDYSGKTDRALFLLDSLMSGNRPEDEIFLMPFTDQVGRFEQLTPEQRLHPSIPVFQSRGSALYDALASALCYMRDARNLRQAVVILTDGVDQQSRLNLDQLTELVRAASPQVFMAGVFGKGEYELYRNSSKTLTIVGLRAIDNPVEVFERLTRESGAESVFATSSRDLKNALGRIAALLAAEYTLGYYPERIDRARQIEVKVARGGAKVFTRGSIGSDASLGGVHFAATGCAVSPRDHPYAWESRVVSREGMPMIYAEDFCDRRSGWPNHSSEVIDAHYIAGGYELFRRPSQGAATAVAGLIATPADTIAAYGPWWRDFRLSAKMECHWRAADSAAGVVFDLNEAGYYAFLLDRPGGNGQMAFELVSGSAAGARSAIIPRTPVSEKDSPGKTHTLEVVRKGDSISLALDNHQLASARDATFRIGLAGVSVFKESRLVIHELRIEAIP